MEMLDQIRVVPFPKKETEDKLQSEEAENAVAEFVVYSKRLRDLEAAGVNKTDNRWWVAVQWLAIADAKLKDLFCDRDRSPRSIAQYHKYRLKLIDGKRYRTDA